MKRARLFALFLFALFLMLCAASFAQSSPGPAPGSSLPGLGGLPDVFSGPGYIEAGGGYSNITGPYSNWTDAYIRGMVSGGHNVFNGEFVREDRFGGTGWLYTLSLTRTLTENWYAQVSGGGSIGGFFLPLFHSDAVINRKLLKRRQLVVTAGGGYDKSKFADYDGRAQVGAAYYFQFPVVVQGGLMWTYSNPGSILARVQYLSATEGYDKEHFITLRYEWGREGYEVVGLPTPGITAPAVLYNFSEHTATATWRQWIGPRWGFNLNVEQHQEPLYHRLGGTLGVFLEF
jgi:YaiO family outer membrane protein